MTTTEFLRIGPGRLRIDPWNDGRGEFVVAPDGTQPAFTASDLATAVASMGRRDVRRLLTPALDEPQQQVFLDAGFSVLDELRLLRHDLHDVPAPARHHLRAGHGRRDLDDAAAIDHAAFGPARHLDRSGLRGARSATPTSRFRFARGRDATDTRDVAYAVCGFSAGNGYLQRLAVAPDCRRSGLGSALVVDGLRWFRRRRALQALVNTEVDNDAALGLYLRLGFVPLPTRLAVLVRTCGST